MGGDSYINLPEPVRDRFVYRIVRLSHLYDLFRYKQNVLVEPVNWDDPYENLRALLAPSGVNAQYRCYGQCWTLQKASDAMWRIYSRDSRAVRIRSTIRKLIESLSRRCGPSEIAFIGQVQYLNTRRLIAFTKRACSPHSGKQSGKVLAKTLLVKRPAFKHEREVRLLLISHNDANAVSSLFRYDVDPKTLIDQIMIDPRVDKAKADALKKVIKFKTEFAGQIKRSLLYAPPEI